MINISKTWKIVIWVLLIFAALGIGGFFWAKSVWNKISFGKPQLLNLNLNGLTLTDLTNVAFNGVQKQVTATVQMDIKNENSFSIPFSSLKVKFFYSGTEIAETSDLLAGNARVPANGTFTGTDTVTITLSNTAVQMLIDKLTNKKATVDYKIMVKVFGIPIPASLQNQSFEI